MDSYHANLKDNTVMAHDNHECDRRTLLTNNFHFLYEARNKLIPLILFPMETIVLKRERQRQTNNPVQTVQRWKFHHTFFPKIAPQDWNVTSHCVQYVPTLPIFIVFFFKFYSAFHRSSALMQLTRCWATAEAASCRFAVKTQLPIFRPFPSQITVQQHAWNKVAFSPGWCNMRHMAARP